MYNIKIIKKGDDFIKGYLLDIFLEESKYIVLKNINTGNITSNFIHVDNLNNPTKIINLQEIVLFLDTIIDNKYIFYNIFNNKNVDKYIEIKNNYKLSKYNYYYCLIANNKLYAWHQLSQLNIKADKIKYIDREKGYTFFNNNKCNDNMVYKIKSSHFLINNNYRVFGYKTYNTFKIIKSIELLSFDIKINHIYNHNKFNFNLFAQADFLNYPSYKRIPVQKLFIAGSFSKAFIDDEFNITGYWKETTSGFIFKVINYKRLYSRNIKVIKNFLLLSLKGNNIGVKTIDNIVDTLGFDSISIIKNNPDKLLEIKGISEKRKDLIHSVILESEYIEDTMSFFVSNKIPLKFMMNLYNKYKLSTIEVIKANPYIILQDHNIPFLLADKIAKNEGLMYNSPLRIKNSILFFLKNDEESYGNLYTDKEYLLKNLNSFILKNGVFKEEFSLIEIESNLNKLIQNKKIIMERSLKDYNLECLYLSYNNFLENMIVDKIKLLSKELTYNNWDKKKIINKINYYEKTSNFNLAKNQKEAIITTLTNKISILTGGPGTGKTQTVNAIIHILKLLAPESSILLAAPTGKASDRLTQITNLPSSTIHRMLKYIPFNNDVELNEIDADLLVIDESSMIDADLFYKLISNISENTNLLFVGDYNQIPSVGAGLILRDLINSNVLPVVVLNEIFRQDKDSTIIDISHNIINGITTNNGLNISNSNDFEFIEANSELDIKNKIIDIVDKEILNYNLNEIQVLTPMNVGNLGTNILNYELQDKFNPLKDEELIVGPTKKFRLNDKVLQTRNNYNINVFNGSLGNISNLDLKSKTPIKVSYDLEDIDYSYTDLEDLMLSYAMTIHKSQGSEFQVVIIPIHESHLFMNNRNLLYTAITRAKSKVYLIGNKDVLNQVILKEDHIKRNSQIQSKLKGLEGEIPF